MKIPFIEYYMVAPDPYKTACHHGTDQRRRQLAEANMERFFSEISKEEYENYLGDNPIFNEMLVLVQDAFQRWYAYDCTAILLSQNYQKHFISYAYRDQMNPGWIHVDQLLETIVLNFLGITLKWAKESEHAAQETSYFIYLVYLMNELCIFGRLPAEDAKAAFMEKMDHDLQIMNLAADCHWAIMVFTTAHEIAHIYQMDTNSEYWEKHPNEAEINADTIAYDILLCLIMNQQGKNLVMEEYAYIERV